MNRLANSSLLLVGACFFGLCLLSILTLTNDGFALTRSIGYPFEGRLENGIPFPREFRGYQLRSVEHTYTTPELIGALLDAIEGVRRDFPDTCDLYLGDFSKPGGGPWYPVHKSHQNGRDVDIGMYAKGNVPINGFVPMSEENLDLEKNLSLVLHLIHSHLVERIFVDSSIQRLLYNYALSRGYDKNFLDKVFQVGTGDYDYTFVRHEPNHRDHMHVRFVAPWSELAGRLENPSPEQKRIIEIAQNSFLPTKVIYFAKDETSPEMLSSKLGVPIEDILKWNRLKRFDAIRPGMPIVFYKRGFDLESVQLALSLDAMLMRSRNQGDLALVHENVMLNIPPMQNIVNRFQNAENREATFTLQPPPHRLVKPTPSSAPSVASTRYAVKKGDTLASIAKKHNISVQELITLNKLSARSALKPGQSIVVPLKSKQNTTTTLVNSTKSPTRLAMAKVNTASNNTHNKSTQLQPASRNASTVASNRQKNSLSSQTIDTSRTKQVASKDKQANVTTTSRPKANSTPKVIPAAKVNNNKSSSQKNAPVVTKLNKPKPKQL
jgi:LysM repeat protein/murein endopeptidase